MMNAQELGWKVRDLIKEAESEGYGFTVTPSPTDRLSPPDPTGHCVTIDVYPLTQPERKTDD